MFELVFVYGTLKRGWGNNRLMDTCEFISEARTLDTDFVMFRRGIPYVRRSTERDPREASSFIEGEVYAVTDEASMARLDALEGHPNWYERKQVRVLLTGYDEYVDAWLYHMDKATGTDVVMPETDTGGIRYV